MFWNQFGDFIDLDPYSSNFVDPDTINPDPHHWLVASNPFSVTALKFQFIANM